MYIVDPIITLFDQGSEHAISNEIEAMLRAHDLNTQRVESQLAPSEQSHRCIQYRSVGRLLKSEFEMVANQRGNRAEFDLIMQAASQFHRPYRMACFDMDSTLIQAEVIDELAKLAGVGADVAAITASAMRGELDFKASFTARMKLLRGLPEDELAVLAAQLPLMTGVQEMMQGLKNRGLRTVILSGGFTYFAEFLQSLLGFDEIHANTLEFEGGRLTGRAVEPIVDGERKAMLLKQIADHHQIPLEQTIAVGDGANDLPMLGLAGLGVAFHAKPKVQAAAEFSLTVPGLDGLLQLFDANLASRA